MQICGVEDYGWPCCGLLDHVMRVAISAGGDEFTEHVLNGLRLLCQAARQRVRHQNNERTVVIISVVQWRQSRREQRESRSVVLWGRVRQYDRRIFRDVYLSDLAPLFHGFPEGVTPRNIGSCSGRQHYLWTSRSICWCLSRLCPNCTHNHNNNFAVPKEWRCFDIQRRDEPSARLQH